MKYHKACSEFSTFPPIPPGLSSMHWKWAVEHKKTQLQKSSGGDLKIEKKNVTSKFKDSVEIQAPLFLFFVLLCPSLQAIPRQPKQPLAIAGKTQGEKPSSLSSEDSKTSGPTNIAVFSPLVLPPFDNRHESVTKGHSIPQSPNVLAGGLRGGSVGTQEVLGRLPRGRSSEKWHHAFIYKFMVGPDPIQQTKSEK